MGPIIEGAIIGALAIVIAGLAAWTASAISRLWHLPKRIDRMEAILPLVLENQGAVLDGLASLARCIENKACNGELESLDKIIMAAKEKMRVFLSGAAISKKE